MKPLHCTICGKKLHDGDSAYATTTGTIEIFGVIGEYGFNVNHREPWLTIACEECGLKISGKIHELIKESRYETISTRKGT